MRAKEIPRSLTEGLRGRRTEIEQAALTRVYSVSGSTKRLDPEYVEGLKVAVSAALEYGIEALERSEDHPAPIPTVLLSQARLAARHGVELDTVLRRYLAGHALLDDFLIEESERGGLPGRGSLKALLRSQATALDRLFAAISEEYTRETKARPGSPEQRRVQRIEGLLAGELSDTSGIDYDFGACHVGVLTTGPGAAEALRATAATLDRNLLLVARTKDFIWAWLGGRRELEFEQIEQAASQHWPAEVPLAVGELGLGFSGWRLTHRQAQAAFSIALRNTSTYTRYADVALLASILCDDLLAASLHQLYMAPLENERDGGVALRETLRVYFESHRNVSSTAAALGVNRHTVGNRLRAVEERINRTLETCAAEVETALRMERMKTPAAPDERLMRNK